MKKLTPYEQLYDFKGIKEAVSSALEQITPEERRELTRKQEKPELDLPEIDNIVFEDIDHNDHPDYCDAFISSADYKGEPMSEDQLDELNENYGDWVHEQILNYLF